MRDDAPPGLLGYVVVSLPDVGEWQGFFVTPAHAALGETMLREVTEANGAGAAAGMATEVDRTLPGTPEGEQATIGALSGVLAELMSRGVARPTPAGAQAQAIMSGVGAAAWALHRVTGQRWLLVAGRRDPHGRPGFATTVRHFEAGTLDEAREAMVASIEATKKARGMADGIGGIMRDPKAGMP